MIIVVFGYPGSGKTYFASALSRELGFTHYNTDKVRKQIVGDPKYTSKEKEEVYDFMVDKIQSSGNIVFDGTFFKQALREQFIDKALDKHQNVYFIEIRAKEEVILERVNMKREDSDAGAKVYSKIKNEFEPLAEEHLILDSSSMHLDEMMELAKMYLEMK